MPDLLLNDLEAKGYILDKFVLYERGGRVKEENLQR